jgi:hypothetical protein
MVWLRAEVIGRAREVRALDDGGEGFQLGELRSAHYVFSAK